MGLAFSESASSLARALAWPLSPAPHFEAFLEAALSRGNDAKPLRDARFAKLSDELVAEVIEPEHR